MKREIQKFFKGEVDDSEEVLKKYSHDASVFEVRPKLVLYPQDSQDVMRLVEWVRDIKDRSNDQELNEGWAMRSIAARWAGTDMSGGAIGESLILDFTRHMNKLVKGPEPVKNSGVFTRQNPTGSDATQNFAVPASITVQPGMFYRDFEKITKEHGLILPCYTASKDLNAMGGMYGNNSAGEKTLKYGKTEDYIVEAKVVFADGVERTVKPFPVSEILTQEEVYKKLFNLIKKDEEEIMRAKPKVHKNSAGYYIWNVLHDGMFDLNKLLVGSQGTLGIATEITFRLVPVQPHSKLVTIFMSDLEPLGRLVDEILKQNPETVEAYDDKTMKLAVRFFPDFLKNKGFIGMVKFMWSFMPEFKMALHGGIPKLILLVEFAGVNEGQVNAQCLKLEEAIKNFKLKVHITKSEAEAEKYWDVRRQSFNLLRKHVKEKRTAPFIDAIIVRPEFLPKFISELNNILGQYDLTYTIAGHAGDGNFHIIPLMDFSHPDTGKIILELSDKVYDLVLRYHGSITAEHNDGIIRTPYLSKMFVPHIIDIFKDIKKIFDPKNILNPGKKVGGSKQYISSHLALEHPKSHHSS